MPEKVTNFANMSINAIHVFGWIVGIFTIVGMLVSGYAIFVVKTIYSKINDIKEDFKEELKYEKSVHKELFDKVNETAIKIAKIETEVENLRKES